MAWMEEYRKVVQSLDYRYTHMYLCVDLSEGHERTSFSQIPSALVCYC